MKRHMLALLTAVCFAGSAALVVACPDEAKHGKSAKTVVHKGKAPCGSAKTATTVAVKEKAPCGATKAKATVKSDCPHAKKATTVADKAKAPCGSSKTAKTVAVEEKAPCGATKAKAEAGCPHAKKATTVADKTKAPCGAKTAKADEDSCCSKSKKATTVAHDGKAGCGSSKTATTVAQTAKAPCGSAKAKGKSSCGHAKSVSASASAGTGDSRVDAILASLPKVTYRVGDETTCCEKTAEKMAEKSGKPLHYVIGDEVLDSHCAAEVRLAELLEKELEQLASLQFAVGEEAVHCPVTARKLAAKNGGKLAYRVAGVDFEDQTRADQAVKLVANALDEVKISYKVGDDTFCCDKMAGMKAKATGKPMSFVVAGEETTCEKHAKMLLMQAKARAAIQAAASTAS